MTIGLVYLGYLWARHRQRVIDTGLVHLDTDVDDVPGQEPELEGSGR
jgi:hypothetical protein